MVFLYAGYLHISLEDVFLGDEKPKSPKFPNSIFSKDPLYPCELSSISKILLKYKIL